MISARDYFAGQALAGVLADPNWKVDKEFMGQTAATCYALADAMLAERSKSK